MPKQGPVGIGVIGAGPMGVEHARLLTRWVKGAEVVAVCGRGQSRAGLLAAEVGAEVAESAQALVCRPDVAGVVVAAPDADHEGLVAMALEAGKPVLCEKPLATTSAATRRLVDRELGAERRLVQVGFMRRFDPGFVHLREDMVGGEIGTPRLLHCIHRNPRPHHSATSIGVVPNSMIHDLDHASWLLRSSISAITVMPATAGRAEGGLLDTQFAIAEIRSGALVSIEVSVNARYGYDIQCEAVGSLGTSRLPAPAAVARRRDGRDSVPIAAEGLERFADAYRLQLTAWVESLVTGIPTGPSAWDGHMATVAAEAGVTSLRTGARVEIPAETRPALYAE